MQEPARRVRSPPFYFSPLVFFSILAATALKSPDQQVLKYCALPTLMSSDQQEAQITLL